jgi:hypothetical protein
MEESREYFEGRAAQCRRLAASLGDVQTVKILSEAALEFDARALAARAADQSVSYQSK